MSVFGTRRRTLTALVGAVALVVVGGGVAFAYWTSSGTGTGTATTGASTDFTITSKAPVGDPLTPGGKAQTVAFTVANPGTGSEYLASVVVTVANDDGTDWVDVEGCSAADYTVSAPVIEYGEIAGGSEVSGTVDITMDDLKTNQDACQGVDVPLYFVASGELLP